MAFIRPAPPRALHEERVTLAHRLKALGFKTAALNILDGAYVANFDVASEACDRFAADPAVFLDVEFGRWCRAPVKLAKPPVMS